MIEFSIVPGLRRTFNADDARLYDRAGAIRAGEAVHVDRASRECSSRARRIVDGIALGMFDPEEFLAARAVETALVG